MTSSRVVVTSAILVACQLATLVSAGHHPYPVPKPAPEPVPEPVPEPAYVKCPKNEVYSKCGNNACQNTCANPNIAQVCRAICNPGCVCAEGYLRNSKRVCVTPEKCDTCKVNEVFSKCSNHGCQNTCTEPDLITRCDYVPGCYPGCICKPGFLRDPSGKCICETLCTKFRCSENQTFNTCSRRCPPEQTCEDYINGAVYFCPIEILPIKCVPRCECKKGFVRQKTNGTCVLSETCCDDPNAEVVDCPNPCPGGTYESPEFAVCPAPCKRKGCQCKSGYVKNSNGKCIQLSICPCVDPNAEMVICPNPCPGGTCEQPKFSICPRPLCINQLGCQCKAGYVKDANGNCILLSQCPSTSTSISSSTSTPSSTIFPECEDPNAELVDCPNLCPGGTCKQPEFSLCPQRACIGSEDRGCQCKEGYVKYTNGRCIPLSQCNGTCNENEVYSACADLCTFDQDCYSLLEGIFPVCTSPLPGFPCTSRCECQQGFVRISNGSCVLPDVCCDDPFAEVVDCPLPCNETCPGVESSCPEYCAVRGCRCKPGLVKNEQNQCVYINQCKCEDSNAEVVDCPNLCPGGTCKQPEFSLCPQRTCFGPEDRGCQCKEGYVKYTNGKCIPLSQCTGTCKDNEVYNPCVDFCTFDQNCYSLIEGIFPVCSIPFPGTPCSSKCECQQGFVRLGNGSCMLPDACCDDSFAELVDCPVPCDETCPEVNSSCPENCAAKRCRCKPGMVRNEQNECVYRNQCAYAFTSTTEYVTDTPQASSQVLLTIPPLFN